MELNTAERKLIVDALQEQRVRNMDTIPEEGHADSKAVKDAIGKHRALSKLLAKLAAFEKEPVQAEAPK